MGVPPPARTGPAKPEEEERRSEREGERERGRGERERVSEREREGARIPWKDGKGVEEEDEGFESRAQCPSRNLQHQFCTARQGHRAQGVAPA